ncbi:MAG: tetratricopeptide repeat protein [Leptolyngbya sp. Prado105]|jgi:tetratricopeptide (TPR) repeat protein|nr:tetratricopeptide repeat protein [Leptolyngbya sp. Prado105]
MPGFDFFKQITDQADFWKVFTPLLAVIIPLIGGGGLVGILMLWLNHRQQWLKQKRYREIPSGDFSFEIIPPNSNTVLKQLMPGSNDEDPLADANIPYLQRQPDRNVRQELERAFEEKLWVLILGRTGLGKTREAAQLAKVLNDEGWTILNLADRSGEWLDEPRQFPSKLRPNAKLLFFLDDLNRWVYHRGNPREIPKDADDPTQPLRVPVQERLLRTIAFFERECRNEVRVIATARNESDHHPDRPHEPSEIEKLQFEKYPDFWKRFYRYELDTPSDEAIVQLLSDLVEAAHLRAKTDEFSQIACRNDGTFRNIIENLRTAANRESVVSVEGLSETLDRTWRVRYKTALKRYPEARYVYDAVEVLRLLNLDLHPAMVEATAKLFVQQRGVKRFWKKLKLQKALASLIKSEEILNPRDGQIEAKGGQVDVRRYVLLVLRKLSDVGKKHYSQSFLASEFFNCGNALHELNHYDEALVSHEVAIAIYDEAIKHKPDDYQVWFNRGLALRKAHYTFEAIKSYDEAIKHKPDFHEAWFNRGLAFKELNDYKNAITSYDEVIKHKPDAHYAWNSRGVALGEINCYEDAITSYDEAIKCKPDDYQAWFNRGNSLCVLQRYEDAITSYNQSLEYNPNLRVAWLGKAHCYALQGNAELAIENLKTLIKLNSQWREWAKVDSAFTRIRNDDRFQALLNEHQNG